jgi:hypothetical protein
MHGRRPTPSVVPRGTERGIQGGIQGAARHALVIDPATTGP